MYISFNMKTIHLVIKDICFISFLNLRFHMTLRALRIRFYYIYASKTKKTNWIKKRASCIPTTSIWGKNLLKWELFETKFIVFIQWTHIVLEWKSLWKYTISYASLNTDDTWKFWNALTIWRKVTNRAKLDKLYTGNTRRTKCMCITKHSTFNDSKPRSLVDLSPFFFVEHTKF